MDNRINLLNKLKLRLQGYVYLGDEIREDRSETLSYYLFECPIHGIVKSYPMGFDSRLECPLCLEEIKYLKEKIGQKQADSEIIQT
jgi:hypothetical protein